MKTTLIKESLRFVVPSVCTQCAIFLFTIIDGIFVGRGVGTDALGAVNLALPYMMVLSAIYMLIAACLYSALNKHISKIIVLLDEDTKS